MDTDPTASSLFPEFSPVTAEAWETKIRADLKGADYEKSLFRTTPEGILIRPFYTRQDMENTGLPDPAPNQFPYLRTRHLEQNTWFNAPLIDTRDGSTLAVQQAIDALAGGAAALEFQVSATGQLNPKELMDAIDLTLVPVQFTLTAKSAAFATDLMAAIAEQGLDTSQLLCQFFFDSLTSALPSGSKELKVWDHQQKDGPLQELVSITVNGAAFHEQGATLVQELAFALAAAVEYANFLIGKGIGPEEVLQGASFRMGIGTNYFMEIAKLRVLRLLWAAVVKAYDAPAETANTLWVQSVTSRWNQTLFDPHTNLLRATTEGMSAIIGGCDFLTLLPYDTELGTNSDFANRIARNISIILKEESYLDKAIDPAAGSYYVESLTAELAEHAWALFQQVEQQGGYASAYKAGFIQEQLEASRSARQRSLATRKENMVGTTQFANPLDKIPGAMLQNANKLPYRASAQFDLLRLRTLQYQQQNPRPQVHLALLGSSSMRKVRADFVQEFFALAGFDAVRVDLKSEPESMQPLADARCVVLCAADEDYAAYTDTIADSLKASGKCNLVLLAGNPAILPATVPVTGIDGFVFMGANAVEVLTNVQKRLGMV